MITNFSDLWGCKPILDYLDYPTLARLSPCILNLLQCQRAAGKQPASDEGDGGDNANTDNAQGGDNNNNTQGGLDNNSPTTAADPH